MSTRQSCCTPDDARARASSDPASCFVLVVVSDQELRDIVVNGCCVADVPARGVGSIAEIEDWPAGQIVVTDGDHVTPFWQTVGATEVIALARDSAESTAALARGATGWLQVPVSSAAVAALVALARNGVVDVQP